MKYFLTIYILGNTLPKVKGVFALKCFRGAKMYFKRIKELRQESARTQINVSTLLELDQSYYSKLERGQHDISIEMLIKIAELYDVSLDYLTERTNVKQMNK